MLESISESNCWKTTTDFFNIKKKEHKELALKIFIVILILGIIHFWHDDIKRFIRSTCRAMEEPINATSNLTHSFVKGVSSVTSSPESTTFTSFGL